MIPRSHQMVDGREILLGVSGGISAYKSCDLLRRLQDLGLLVTVVPTRSSLNFVGTATWEALSGREVPLDLWNNVHQVPHISLAKKAAAIVIAPATADVIAKFAMGIADDLLSNIVLAATCPIILVPAMHTEMWLNEATASNIATLRTRGFIIVEPDSGRLSSGDVGLGRYPETSKIINSLEATLELKHDLTGRQVLISAGGTREPIDPVRYIGNRSSGKQGYALAYAAALRGAQVTLVAANVDIPDIEGITTVHVETALEMAAELETRFAATHILIMAAAIADVRPVNASPSKIDKEDLKALELVGNPDIIAALTSRKSGQVVIGFAAQTQNELEAGLAKAAKKLQDKNLDFIYFNDVSNGAIFASENTQGVIMSASGDRISFPEASKLTLANKLLDFAIDKLG